MIKRYSLIAVRREVSALLCVAMLCGLGVVGVSGAEGRATPQWVWAEGKAEVEGGVKGVEGTRYFRVDFDWTSQAHVYLSVACTQPFVAYVNGYELGRSEGGLVSVALSESGFIGYADNVIAVEVMGNGVANAPAGLMVRGVVRGRKIEKHVVTDGAWKTSKQASVGWNNRQYDDSSWRPVSVLGPEGGVDRWRDVVLPEQEAGAFTVPEGFAVETYATPEQAGSVIAMALDWRGRPIISRENDSLYLLEDDDEDGRCDRVRQITDQLMNCQGICEVEPGVLYAIGHGPGGLAIYRVEYDVEKSDAESTRVELVLKYDLNQASEHGPHGITVGPDGRLYAIMGNFAQPDEKLVDSDSPLNIFYEGNYPESIPNPLRFGNGYGAPAGTIIRADSQVKKWSRLAGGLRNPYDLAFNRHAEIFTYDSDMDWDFELPWYRPVRVNHVVDGADYGWRAGSGKWPAYQPDSLPELVDIGRGSPTGVITYQHNQFPKKYHDTLFLCDWTRGQIIAVHNQREGGSYRATTEVFATGSPLNATDIEVAPDGSLLVSTGGRTTRGGVYRVVYGQNESMWNVAKVQTAGDLVTVPQPLSAWARAVGRKVMSMERIKTTMKQLAKIMRDSSTPVDDRLAAINYYVVALEGNDRYTPKQVHAAERVLIDVTADGDAEVRARAALALGDVLSEESASALNRLLGDRSPIVRRRVCEAFIRSGQTPDLKKIVSLLGDSDQWVRHAARTVLEHQPIDAWRGLIRGHEDLRVVANALLMQARLADDSPAHLGLLDSTQRLLADDLDEQSMLATVRAAQLIFAKLDSSYAPQLEGVVEAMSRRYPTGQWRVDREMARILAGRSEGRGFDLLYERLQKSDSIESQIHYATCLSTIQSGWDLARVKAILPWLEKFAAHQGGTSYIGYIQVICSRVIGRLDDSEQLVVLREAPRYPFVGRMIVRQLDEKQLAHIGPMFFDLVTQTDAANNQTLSDDLAEAVINRLANGSNPQSGEILNRMYTQMPARQTAIARVAAVKPHSHMNLLWRMMGSENSATLTAILGAIEKISQRNLTEEQQRAVLIAAMRLGALGADRALRILESDTGASFGLKEKGWGEALKVASSWYGEKYPNAKALPKVEISVTHTWAYSELSDRLLHPNALKNASPQRGLAALQKAQCLTCHRFGAEGRGDIGPDLTLLGKRFDRNQVLESILDPSATVSDQYQAVLVTMADGESLLGMTVEQTETQMTLALMDGARRDIRRDTITQSQSITQSMMPPGLLNTLTLEEIADMLALLEKGPIGK